MAETRIRRLTDLLSIPGGPGDEQAVVDFIIDELVAAGVDRSQISQDSAHRKIGYGHCGNLIVKLPARGQRAPRALFSAHMDTVPLCVGNRPVRNGEWIVGKDPHKGLGGDDRAGCAVLLNTLCDVVQSGSPHPPLTFAWLVQEEVGLRGARHISPTKLANPRIGFNFDGRSPEGIVIGATGDVAIEITIRGLASHAGVHPERGVSAAAVLAQALGELVAGGWHGLIKKGKQSGTSNVGVLDGGAATNVVMDELQVRAEVRSHSKTFRSRIVKTWRKAFEDAARQTKNDSGVSASIDWSDDLKYEAFALKKSDSVVRMATAAVKAIGRDPEYIIGNGGLDANWLVAHGIPTVTFGCGQHDIHTVDEKLHVASFEAACDLALHLATNP